MLLAALERRDDDDADPAEKSAKKQEEGAREAVGDRVKKEAGERSEEIRIAVGERNRKGGGSPPMSGVTMQDWEALLLEIARRSAGQTIKMPNSHVPVPAEIVEEAVRQGARGPEIGLWVAAVAAVLAAALAGGGKAALAVPGVLRAVTDLPRSVRPGGTMFNSAAALEFAIQSIGGRSETGDGEFFPGILG